MGHDVFVSYSQKDKAVADAVVARLEQDGSRCWVAPRDILPGTSWGSAIAEAIAASRVMVLVLSTNSNRSRQVVREVERAVAGDVIILPFRIDPADPTGALAYFLGTEHWLDALTPPLERHIERLGRTVRLLLAREPVPREELDTPPAALARRRRRPWGILTATAAAVAVVAVAGAAVVALLASAPTPVASPTPGPGASAGPSTSGAVPSPSASASGVHLEEVGRYRPLDLDPTDLAPPGSILDFDVDGAWLAYANGVDGVTRLAIDDPAEPRPAESYAVGDARAVALAGASVAVASGEYGTLEVNVLPVDGSGGAGLPLEAGGVTEIYGLEASDGYLYASTHNWVAIIDARDPGAPRLAFEWTPPEHTGVPATTFVADGVGYFGAGSDGLYVFDLADPAKPALLGHWDSPNWVIDIVVVDGIAYLSLGKSGIVAVDVTQPASPRLLGTLSVPGFAGPLDVAHGHAFVGWYGDQASPGGIAVVDLADPTAPALVESFGPFPTLGRVEVAGDHLFVSDESEGLIVLRIAGLP